MFSKWEAWGRKCELITDFYFQVNKTPEKFPKYTDVEDHCGLYPHTPSTHGHAQPQEERRKKF